MVEQRQAAVRHVRRQRQSRLTVGSVLTYSVAQALEADAFDVSAEVRAGRKFDPTGGAGNGVRTEDDFALRTILVRRRGDRLIWLPVVGSRVAHLR